MDERSFNRVDVDRTANVVIGRRSVPVLVYNLSVTGCMLESADDGLALGDVVSISLKGVPVILNGKIVWRRDGHAGVHFDASIGREIVDRLGFKPTASAMTMSASARPAGSAACQSAMPDDGGNGGRKLENRHHPRIIVDCHMGLELGDQRSRVLVYDLSISGCMFEAGDEPPAIGQEVSLVLAAAPESAEIVWVFGSCAGAKFKSELHPAIIAYYGFTPSQIDFNTLMPRDKFGRLLPALGKMSA